MFYLDKVPGEPLIEQNLLYSGVLAPGWLITDHWNFQIGVRPTWSASFETDDDDDDDDSWRRRASWWWRKRRFLALRRFCDAKIASTDSKPKRRNTRWRHHLQRRRRRRRQRRKVSSRMASSLPLENPRPRTHNPEFRGRGSGATPGQSAPREVRLFLRLIIPKQRYYICKRCHYQDFPTTLCRGMIWERCLSCDLNPRW